MNINEIKNKILSYFNGLLFDESSHTYSYKGNSFLSTTTYISKFSDKFDPYFPSEAKGKKNLKNNPDDRRDGLYYRTRWNLIRDEASNRGSRVHLFAECYPDFDIPSCNKEKGIIEFYEWLADNYEVLFMELRIFDKLSYKAGTIDGVLYNKDTGKLVLIDWKTNNKNLLEYYKSKKLKYDFNGLYATDLNKYSIQLSDYKYMIEKCTDFEVEEMWIIWLTNFNINELTMGRSGDYNIDNVEPFMDTSNYKIFKLEDYSNIISYHVEKDLKYIKSKSKKTKFKFRNTEKVTFTKKKSKNKSLTSKIKKAKNNENK